jgi:NADPH:quinone reductase-like Zn-dependent oxidoreductase
MGAANSIGVTAGETVLVLPATGFFSSSAIVAALALGATVVVGGRSKEKLDGLVKHFGEDGKRITPVVLTGDAYADAAALRAATPGGRGADAYIDYSPPMAAGTTHIEAGLLALKRYGRYVYISRLNPPNLELQPKSLHIDTRLDAALPVLSSIKSQCPTLSS